ncbi:hypothetical protein FXO38_22780 [Capsicum annuum]|nr:hypothetical protein FXO38_22780 [Capsicum annuum]
MSRGVIGWVKFKEELCNGFSVEPDVAEEFNKLSQTESVGELLVKFEELKAQMLMRNPNLSESHFLSSFVGALKEEIKGGDIFAPGHICKKKQLNYLVGEVVPVVEINEEPSELILEGQIEQEVQEVVCLSALTGGNRGVNFILVKGIVKNRNLVVRVDNGSTHSFIDEHTVKETGNYSNYCSPVRVTVVDGNHAMCKSNCKGFTWKMQGKTFQEDLLMIPLRGCDLVLGNDWMKKNNSTKFDHEKNSVTIELKTIRSSMGKVLKRGHAIMAQLFLVIASVCSGQAVTDDQIQHVLVQYADVFHEPKSLPPVRSLDHVIPLKSGATPVSLRHHKNELERQVKEMLDHGIIQQSQSHFSSSALLVKKKDNTWRFCVDYRGLNEITIKYNILFQLLMIYWMSCMVQSFFQRWTLGLDIIR